MSNTSDSLLSMIADQTAKIFQNTKLFDNTDPSTAMTLQDELDHLKKIGFLPSEVTKGKIQTDLHINQCWADAFWRRRDSHQHRSDPEIEVIKQLIADGREVDQALEIGAAYGRVTYKLAQLEGIRSITGIDICKYFADYTDITAVPEHISFIYDDLFTTHLDHDAFDLIVLPMNTLPSFPITSWLNCLIRSNNYSEQVVSLSSPPIPN